MSLDLERYRQKAMALADVPVADGAGSLVSYSEAMFTLIGEIVRLQGGEGDGKPMFRNVKVRARVSIQGIVSVEGRSIAECEQKAIEAVEHTIRYGHDSKHPTMEDVEIVDVDVEADVTGPGGETR